MRTKWLALTPLALIGVCLFAALGGAVVMLLWNALLPSLFRWPALTFWQALGLLVLCRILFGGLGGGGSPRSHLSRRLGERWRHMTPEERERIRAAMSSHLGTSAPGGDRQES